MRTLFPVLALVSFLAYAPIPLAAEGNAAVDAPLPAADPLPASKAEKQSPISQSIAIELSQSGVMQKIREDGMANSENWMEMPEWWLPLQAKAEWSVDIAGRVSIALSPEVSWKETGGTYSEDAFKELESQIQDPIFGLERAEARFSLREAGLQAIFGKLRPQFGVNYIAPLSLANPRGRDEYEDGLWMGGLFLAIGDISFEAYCQTVKDPVVVAAASGLFGLHEAGIVFRREYANAFGAWYRGQIGDGLIPYAECMLREKGDFLDIQGLPARGIGWNVDALAGLGFSPESLNLSCYLEYRFRQAGYAKGEWDDLRGLSPPDQASLIGGFPYLQSAVHSLGLHLRNADEIGGFFSWSLSCVYLFAEAGAQALLFDRLALGAKASSALLLGSDADSSASEMALWPYVSKLSLYATWKMNAKE
jgi:hypothetical protein